MAIDQLANRSGIRVERPEGKALVGRGKIGQEEVILAKPQTYMNLSGVAVRDLLGKCELNLDDLLVIWDEKQLPWGTIRIHPEGSDGGHNGAKSVISTLGTKDFARIRIGCGPDHPVGDLAAYVLRPMKKAELEVAAEMAGQAGDAVEMILAQGIDAAVIKYQTVRLDEDLKRQKKLSQKREKRAARRPRRTTAPAPAPAPEQAAATS